MKILLVAGELYPYAAVSGLGEELWQYASALAARGHEVRAILPMYDAQDRSSLRFAGGFHMSFAGKNPYCGIYTATENRMTVYLIESSFYFNRMFYCDSHDDGERYAFFCRAALAILPVVGFRPDVLHAHDWQAALCVVYLKRYLQGDPFYRDISAVYTVHRIAFQGIFDGNKLSLLGIPEKDAWIFCGCGGVNLTAGALILADALTTVSGHYARELLSDSVSYGLGRLMRANCGKLWGILCGIDPKRFDPESGMGGIVPFSAEDCLDGKRENKKRLQTLLDWEADGDAVLLYIPGPLFCERGMDQLAEAAVKLLGDGMQLIVSGTGEMRYAHMFMQLQRRCPKRMQYLPDFRLCSELLLYAASDFVLLAPKQEPCGSAQMIACRFGAVPIVRATGGLADAVQPFCGETGKGNGYLFSDFHASSLYAVVKSAALRRSQRTEEHRTLVQNAMQSDFSWNRCAAEYERLFLELKRR